MKVLTTYNYGSEELNFKLKFDKTQMQTGVELDLSKDNLDYTDNLFLDHEWKSRQQAAINCGIAKEQARTILPEVLTKKFQASTELSEWNKVKRPMSQDNFNLHSFNSELSDNLLEIHHYESLEFVKELPETYNITSSKDDWVKSLLSDDSFIRLGVKFLANIVFDNPPHKFMTSSVVCDNGVLLHAKTRRCLSMEELIKLSLYKKWYLYCIYQDYNAYYVRYAHSNQLS